MTDADWQLLLAASAGADAAARGAGPRQLQYLQWQAAHGWASTLRPDDPRAASIDIYLPICSATPALPIVIGHLGQSLDGFIATPSGDSQFVTGEENILHLHRIRALCDAVVVGAGTVAADNPQLTTRLVAGPNPLRVIFDPTARLADSYRVFTDDAAPTLLVTKPSVSELLDDLRQRGCYRIFVEGGGVTVSAFLEAGLLDRLHVAVAPLLIGEGRPAIRLAPQEYLRDCRRPSYRVFRMGGDVLFDCDLRAERGVVAADSATITRVI